MKKKGQPLVASNDLIDRKGSSSLRSLVVWASMPEDRATVRGAFTREGSVMLLLESQSGELREFYAEHVALDPK